MGGDGQTKCHLYTRGLVSAGVNTHNCQPTPNKNKMVCLDNPTPLLGIDMPQCTYFYSDIMVIAVEPLVITRVMELGAMRFVFLDDALPLDVCFMTTQDVVDKINQRRTTFGLPPTSRYLAEVEILTPLVTPFPTLLQ
jgi:hypothetical protein